MTSISFEGEDKKVFMEVGTMPYQLEGVLAVNIYW